MRKIEKDTIRREILSKYYHIEGNTATITLSYDTFSTLIDQSFGDSNIEKLNNTLFEDIDSAIELLPNNYDVNIDLNINDFEDYNIEEARRIVKENIKLKIYNIALIQYRKHKESVALILSGIALLIASYFCSNIGWPDIVFDLVNISGTLFIWEGITIEFIERNETFKHSKRLLKKIKEINLIDMNQNK